MLSGLLSYTTSHSKSPALRLPLLFSTDIAPLEPTVKASSCQILVDIFQTLNLLVLSATFNLVSNLFPHDALVFHHIIPLVLRVHF